MFILFSFFRKTKCTAKMNVNKALSDLNQNWEAMIADASSNPEKRVARDGQLYTKQQFIDFYGGTTQWDAASPATPQDSSRMIIENRIEYRIELKSIELN